MTNTQLSDSHPSAPHINNSGADDIPLEGATFTPRQVRYLWMAVILMGIALLVGFFVVIGKIIYDSTQGGKKPASIAAVSQPPEPAARGVLGDISLPAARGSSVKSFTLDGGRMAVHLTSPLGEEIVVLELQSGDVLARVTLKSK